MWNKIDFEIERICASVNETVDHTSVLTDKIKQVACVDKLNLLMLAGQSEILDLKKKHSEEIDELSKMILKNKNEIALLMQNKQVNNQLKKEKLSD